MNFEKFRNIKTWVFDLDNTLYPPEVCLFDQIEEKMRIFVANFLDVSLTEADTLRAMYWQSHGTTLAGMMDIHSMPPDSFLKVVHDIDFSVVPPSPSIAKLLAALPGRKIVYTNGTEPYARKVLQARELENEFEAVFGIEHADYHPKPLATAFKKVFNLANVTPNNSAMFEDDHRNLEVPAQLGMKTVFVSSEQKIPNYVDVVHPSLEFLLSQIVTTCFPKRLKTSGREVW
ncbi:pyrimidine 5'-nucleotidase [Planktomarina sp.]|nr:pyrimidine 5'-nucleotidase [Planktomarina sp.]